MTMHIPYAVHETFEAAFGARLREHPNKQFLRHGKTALTFAEVDAACASIASHLRVIGVTKGDRVAVIMPNSVEHVLTLLTCMRTGTIQVPLNHEYNSDAIERLLGITDPTVIFADVQYESLVSAALAEMPFTPLIVWSDVDQVGTLEGRAHTLDHALTAEPLDGWQVVEPWDAVQLIMTSGTTGAAKAVEVGHGYLLHLASEVVWHQVYTDDDVLYSPYPLFHGDAPQLTVVPGLLVGCTVAVGRKFSASRFWDEIRHHGATVFDYMGAVLAILDKAPKRDDDADNPVRLAWGAPAPANWREIEKRFGLKIRETYGATERCLPFWESPDKERRDGTAGRLCEHHEARIVDSSGRDVATGEPGQILIRSRVPFGQMSGYYRNPEATVASWKGLWHNTGDLGKISTDGYLTFVGRLKDVIRRRGRNIGAEEIETIAMKFDHVIDVAAIAVPSELTEDDIKLVVEVHKPVFNLDGFVAALEERLPRYMVPRYVEVVSAMARTPTGKVDKNHLRSRWRTEGTVDLEIQASDAR